MSETTLTFEMIKEAEALLKALAPYKSPSSEFFLTMPSGLSVMKNPFVPEGTVILSQDLFDLIFNTNSKAKEKSDE